ncbi:MAG: hypothetical protein CVV58_00985 [Tenericutes bacterium HGW-Tenericutes-3]|nr:MAG: hypothetical protein CVV58_00985 [Tenericutes bacterium HGW-Tenericutes-3]
MTTQIAWLIFWGFFLVTLYLVLAIVIQKSINRRVLYLRGLARDFLFKRYFDQEDVKSQLSNRFFFDAFIDIETHIEIEPEVRKRVIDDLILTRFAKKQLRRINSLSPIKRKIAIFYISALNTQKSRELLEKRFDREKNDSVRFYLVFALKEFLNVRIFDKVVESLIGSNDNYQRWIQALLKNHYTSIQKFVLPYFDDQRAEIKKLLIDLSSNTIDENLKKYALRQFHESILEPDIRLLALRAIGKMHPHEIANEHFCKNENTSYKKVAIKAASSIVTKEMVEALLQSMDGTSLDQDRVDSLSKIIYESTDLMLYILEWYNRTKNRNQQLSIAHVLSHRIDYLMLKIESDGYEYIIKILEDMLELHIVEDFIDFINLNKKDRIEKLLIPMMKKYADKDKYIREQFSIYINSKLLDKLKLPKIKQPVIPREKSPIEKSKNKWIINRVIFAIIIFPLIYFVTKFRVIFSGTVNVFEYMIISINNYLVIYFAFANLIYILLLMISLKGSKERLDLWRIKKQTMLFEHDILPSISIVAPAYNEEKSIIESVTSLLNLKYPKYEVIVVNDGSKDNTINVLIEHFELERKHPFFTLKLKTKALRGAYVNKHIPNLIVIDKQNGGKADALNLGINVAKNDFICGIDADSLLEEDALLKLMSVTLDHTVDHIALGGNIVPVNGCVVDKGKIEHSGLGKDLIVRFQTLEYLRAFTTGRIGWSKLRSLLIVSGAFGLFQRKSLIETGGYLTISGDLKKDTVGEDMELVVRLTFEALKKKMPYRVEYVHQANCYTELPNDLRSLLKQRNRWQRGLLDILSYHRKLLFNPRYKQPGMIAFPYFFIFEMIGPFLETIGYIALIIGLFMGILNMPIIITLFVATIGLGIVISLFSLMISEKRNYFYTNKETGILILIAILENFGYRQMMSLQRALSTFSALRENGSWGSQKRQGFKTK